ncbi:unnamed protein product [Cyprideis torosa]|uniref:Bestrophin homolog n=1 Tax=Cyprideis torosa TaxID=163714 RepID=A0A7R8WC49_9CRUS|nr:unnamed protein product [Cyprideis torosa]CAG0888063.1 unnamed protein product [Cyprideis torosa]
MTVSYTKDFSEQSYFRIWKLFRRYRGSLIKATLKDYLLYLTLYFFLSSIYRFALTHEQKRTFESISLYFSYNANSTIVIFVLGFYVSIVYTRWWSWYQSMPWPQQVGLMINGNIQGEDDRSRLIRKTMIRYVNLAYVMTMSRLSSRVKTRFPTLQHLVTAGLLQKEEMAILEDLEGKTPATYWVPIIWCTAVATLAFNEKRIISAANGHQLVISQLEDYRAHCCKVIQWGWINFPLMYTQVATLAVYTYILASVLGNQWLDPALKYPNHRVDMYFPFHSSLMFFIFMGLLRAAFAMINPFGEDDEDFEINNIIDHNFQSSYLMVGEVHDQHPELVQDFYWNRRIPPSLPHTAESEAIHEYTAPEKGSIEGVGMNNGKEFSARGSVLKRMRFSKKEEIPRFPANISGTNDTSILSFLKTTSFSRNPSILARRNQNLNQIHKTMLPVKEPTNTLTLAGNYQKSFHSRSSKSKPEPNPQDNASRKRTDEYADPGRQLPASLPGTPSIARPEFRAYKSEEGAPDIAEVEEENQEEETQEDKNPEPDAISIVFDERFLRAAIKEDVNQHNI